MDGVVMSARRIAAPDPHSLRESCSTAHLVCACEEPDRGVCVPGGTFPRSSRGSHASIASPPDVYFRMKLPRRTFLSRTALGAAGVAAGVTSRGAETKTPSALPTFDAQAPETFWSAVRAQFPLSRDLIYFNTGGLGPTSEPVLAIMAETTRKLQARSEHGHGLFTDARAVVARFLGADAT